MASRPLPCVSCEGYTASLEFEPSHRRMQRYPFSWFRPFMLLNTPQKRRAVLIDTLICVLFPIVQMVLGTYSGSCLFMPLKSRVAYIVQGHRFDIFEQVGCYPNIVSMLPSFFLVIMWPILIGIISAIYCGRSVFLPFISPPLIPMTGLTLWSFLQRQAQFSQFMTANSTLTMSRYLRLMALAGVELLCTTPLSLFLMILDATAQPLDPWISWDDTHSNFSNVRLIPAVIWNMNRWTVVGIQFNRWSGPLCAFVFFAFFGFASEARKNYYKTISKVLVICRLKRDSSLQKASPRSVLCSISILIHSCFCPQPSQAHHHVFFYTVSCTPRIHVPPTLLPTSECCDNPVLP